MSQFHELLVVDVRNTTREAVVVTLQPSADADFDFIQGQYLTFRRVFDGVELRRSYSICSARHEQLLQVGIKKVIGGAFSSWVNDSLSAGDTLEAMQPMGNFHVPIEPDNSRRYLGFAGGSGITPVLSILKTVLAEEPLSRFTLVYANRGLNSIMFREELEDLKNTYMHRLSIIHILESDAQEIELFTGRVDSDKCRALFAQWIDIEKTDIAFICGPEPMMLEISASLKDHGMSEGQIKYELFASNQPGKISQRSSTVQEESTSTFTKLDVTMDGSVRSFEMDSNSTILEALLANAVDAPFACRAGVCSTCRCKIVKGEIEMASNHALEDYEVERGYALACQAYPISDYISVDYDQ